MMYIQKRAVPLQMKRSPVMIALLKKNGLSLAKQLQYQKLKLVSSVEKALFREPILKGQKDCLGGFELSEFQVKAINLKQ